MNSTCDEKRNLIYNPMYAAWSAAPITTGIGSLVVAGFLMKHIGKEIWHRNVHAFMTFYILCRAILAITSMTSYGKFLYYLATESNPCQVFELVGSCQIFRLVFLASFISLTLTNYAMLLDRAVAFLFSAIYYPIEKPFFASRTIPLIVLASFGISYFVLASENHLDMVPHCLSFSSSKIATSMKILFIALFCAELMLAVGHVGLLEWEKRLSAKFKLDLIERGIQLKNKTLIKQLVPLNLVSAFIIGSCILAAYILENYGGEWIDNDDILQTCLTFVVPHIPLVLNLGSLLTFWKHYRDEKERRKKNRKEREKSQRRPPRDHFEMLNEMWNDAFDRKFPNGRNKKKVRSSEKKAAKLEAVPMLPKARSL